MRTQVGVLIGGIVFAWLIASYPAYRIDGMTGLLMSGSAALLSLIPGVVTFLWGLKAMTGTPTDRMQHAMLGMLLRMVVVLGGGLVLYVSAPGFEHLRFWLWIAGFYLGTLALETVLLNHAPQAKAVEPSGKTPAGA